MTAGEWVAARVKATVKSSGYGSAEDKGEDEAKKEYNRLQALINRNQGAEQIEKPFARI